jgi:hypothetical protein
MITDWRALFPTIGTFGFVQIAPWTGYSTMEAAGDLRQAQLTALSLSRIVFATTLDLVQ